MEIGSFKKDNGDNIKTKTRFATVRRFTFAILLLLIFKYLLTNPNIIMYCIHADKIVEWIVRIINNIIGIFLVKVDGKNLHKYNNMFERRPIRITRVPRRIPVNALPYHSGF